MLLILTLAVTGCGRGVKPVTGGTTGVLRAGGTMLSDIQVTVHENDGGSWRPIGFAITDSDGAFELVANGARGPLELPDGDYRCTLESAGAPVEFPREFTKADTTPLKITWASSDGTLDLKVPAPTPTQ